MQAVPLSAILLAVFFWGLTPVATRYAIAFVSPADLLILRFVCSGALCLPLLATVRLHQWSSKELALVGVCSGVGVAGYNIPVAYGAQWVPAGTTGLLIATEPIWILVLGLLFRQRPTWSLLLGLTLGSAGVALLLGYEESNGDGGSFRLGALLILIGALMWALYCMLIPAVTRRHGPIRCTAIIQTVGALPFAVLWEPGLVWRSMLLPPGVWLTIAFLAVFASVISVVLWNYGLSRMSTSDASVFLYLIPLITVLGGVLLLGERAGFAQVVGGAMIVAGVAISQLQSRPARL